MTRPDDIWAAYWHTNLHTCIELGWHFVLFILTRMSFPFLSPLFRYYIAWYSVWSISSPYLYVFGVHFAVSWLLYVQSAPVSRYSKLRYVLQRLDNVRVWSIAKPWNNKFQSSAGSEVSIIAFHCELPYHLYVIFVILRSSLRWFPFCIPLCWLVLSLLREV